MPLRFEAWTLPELPGFARKFPIKDTVDHEVRIGARGRGSLVLPSEHPRIAEILTINPADHSQDVGSLIRAYDGEDLVTEFYAMRTEEAFNDAKRLVKITGDDISQRALAKLRVRQYDYNVSPSVDRDWQYGGDNKHLRNESFEDVSSGVVNGDAETGDTKGWRAITGADTNKLQTNVVPDGFEASTEEVFEGTHSFKIDPTLRHGGIQQSVDVLPGARVQVHAKLKEPTASGKRYTLLTRPDDGSILHTPASQGSFKWNGDYLVELDGTPQNPAHNGLPGGASDGSWQDLTIDLRVGSDQEKMVIAVQYDQHDGSGGPIFFVDNIHMTGVGVGVAPWKEVGNLRTFTVDQTHTYDGENAALVRALNSQAGVNGIRQEIENLTPGRTYTSGVWLYQETGANRDFRLIHKLPAGSWTGSTLITVPSGVWTEVTLTSLIDSDEIWWDLRIDGSYTPFDFWVDKAFMAEGLAAATYGRMSNDLMDDAGVDHVLIGRTAGNWLIRTYGDLLDSNGDPWDDTRAAKLKRGQTYRRFHDFMAKSWGYEQRVRTNPANELEHFLDLYNPEGMGTVLDQEGDPAILRPSATGPLVRREPGGSYAMAEGDEGAWGEATDADVQTAWGPSEEYAGTHERLEGSLIEVAEEHIKQGVSKAEGLKITLEDPAAIPGVAYGIGDTVTVVLGEATWPKLGYRVAAITIKHVGPGRDKYQVDVGSTVYSNPTGSGQAEAVARLLEAFEGLTDLPDFDALLAAAEGPLPVIPDAMIAAANARSEVKAIADFKGDGTADEDVLNAALAFVADLNSDGARLVMAGGEFFLSDDRPVTITVPDGVALYGMGRRQSKILYFDTMVFDVTLLYGDASQLRHFGIEQASCGG